MKTVAIAFAAVAFWSLVANLFAAASGLPYPNDWSHFLSWLEGSLVMLTVAMLNARYNS